MFDFDLHVLVTKLCCFVLWLVVDSGHMLSYNGFKRILIKVFSTEIKSVAGDFEKEKFLLFTKMFSEIVCYRFVKCCLWKGKS